MKIRAAVARAGSFTIEECELDTPREREVLVRVEACGVCHTDLTARDHAYGTPLPAVLGHEGIGRVEALGPGVTDVKIGDRVIMSFGACGQCQSCLDNAPGYCQHAVQLNVFGKRLAGPSPITFNEQPITGHFFGQSSFATHAIAATRNLVPIADDLPAAPMAALACGVQTGVGAVFNVLQTSAADTVGIFGCGTVGLAAVMAAKIAGCRRIVAVDLRPARLDLARALGATDVVDNSTAGPVALRELGLTAAFDSTGVPAVIEAAFAALRPRGRLALAGLSPRGATLSIDANRLMSSGRTVRGTIEGDADPPRWIPRMIDWYRRGLLPVDRIVTTYPFDRIDQAAADMLAGHTVIKPVLLMPGGPS